MDVYSKGPHSKPPVSLIGQLLWREFFYTCGATIPNFNQMKGNSICRQIPWREDDKKDKYLNAWKTGTTGFPFIDAIMTQLRQEGWIHHLARHSVACFLTRGDLWVSWEEGQAVFEELLLDADWSLNAGNWSVMHPENNNLTCARYMFGATLEVPYKDILGNTSTAKIFLDNSTSIAHSGTCYNSSSETSFVLFNLMLDDSTTNFTFTFNISGDTYDLVDIHVEYDPISQYFPNHENISESTVDIATGDVSLFSTETDHCYKCDASTGIAINGTATITFENMQLQPFGINSTTGEFSAESVCEADNGDMSVIIPIIVGAVLAILIVIVIVAYVVGRTRANNENSYDAI